MAAYTHSLIYECCLLLFTLLISKEKNLISGSSLVTLLTLLTPSFEGIDIPHPSVLPVLVVLA